MAAVDQSLRAALKAEALYVRVPANPATRGREVKVISPFASRSAAEAEAARIAQLLSGPLVKDRVLVPGQRQDLVGRCVSLQGGPAAGAVVRVIGCEPEGPDTALTVLRKLP